ncbi:hypothetical protein LCGC14_0387880 [marine sediment metagenome]|uniref:Uncharacterized protein n=1 Tax=marine sediment metagenome TaxID=412755 RepID=A0A0F9VMN2_9ZZZZ
MVEELLAQIKVVAGARKKAKELADKRQALYDEFTTLHCDFFADVATAKSKVALDEEKLRELALQAYAETGEKAPAPGVGIRELTKLEYDAGVAFDWAKAHKMALKLDTTAFEKIVKADTPEFVKVTTEPQATIATDLDAILTEGQ